MDAGEDGSGWRSRDRWLRIDLEPRIDRRTEFPDDSVDSTSGVPAEAEVLDRRVQVALSEDSILVSERLQGRGALADARGAGEDSDLEIGSAEPARDLAPLGARQRRVSSEDQRAAQVGRGR